MAMKSKADIDRRIHSLRGSLKRKPGEKSITQELLKDRAEDLRLEEAKWARFEKRCRDKQAPAKRSGRKR